MNMNYYYDKNLYYPYLCLSDINDADLKEFIEFLKSNNLAPNKFYEKPKYPASNGVNYDFVLRINYENIDTKTKPSEIKINNLINEFIKSKPKNLKIESKNISEIELVDNEKKYFKEIRIFLNSERKLLELDRQFLKEQINSLSNLSQSLKDENQRIITILNLNNDKLTTELSKIINNKNFSNQDIKEIDQKLNQKDQLLKEREDTLKQQEIEFLERIEEFSEWKEKQETIYKNRIESIREFQLGINSNEKEDTIQDIRILCFGESRLDSNKIYEIFNKEFFKIFGEELNRKSIDAQLLSYNDVKNSNVNSKIKQNKYDYIIIGQHDHSTKGKKINQSYPNFIKENNLKAKVFEERKSNLNQEILTELSVSIMQNWEESFE